ncbi:hypothetical protein FKG94_22255 [Exilibacterium tricleocarpae]|uniref:Uncharacterized protein n=1 Tax=Exilibacterium tricleocarpae TaxID=2591008 RepID=A0A545SY36_9GAMM|nr:hypothetical protein [Exilibacterium tricleocarpae]TQV69878.1 hypothetical protein FKG94_22255 [Exilibacterium tricleocarpae]
MQAKRILPFFVSLLFFTITGCGGGGGSSSNPGNPDPNPVDPGPQNRELQVTVSGLVAELTVTWQGQTIVLNPDRLSTNVEAPGPAGGAPEYSGPQYQNCSDYELVETDNGYNLTITCAEPDPLQLRVTIAGLQGELGVQWFDQNRSYDGDITGALIESRPGVLVEPSITAMPALQNCAGEFVATDQPLAFTYNIECTERVVTHHIVIDAALPYPVTLALADQEPIVIQQESVRFPTGSSPLDTVSITAVGGTQRCELDRQVPGENRDEQHWSLSCREYLVYGDPRAENPGIYLTYGNGEKFLLESGDPGSYAVDTYTSLDKQAVLHPDFGARILEFSDSGVSWRPMDQIPAGTIFQTLFTDNVAYMAIVSQRADGPFYHVWSIGSNLETREVTTNSDENGHVRLIPVSPRADIVGIDYLFLSNRFVRISASGQETDTATTVEPGGEVHAIKTPPFQGQRLSWIFRANETTGRLDANFFGSPQTVPDFHPDAQANVAVWYDDAGNERVLLLGAGVGGPDQPRQLVELDLLLELAWTVPLDLPVPQSVGYMGTDERGQTLVITRGDDDLEDGLALLATTTGPVDLDALSRAVGITGQLRVRPEERENAGGIYRTAQAYKGWLLLFEGGATGNVWLTDGSAAHTWKIDEGVAWTAFRGGAYNLVAAGATMAAVSYERAGTQMLALPGVSGGGIATD